MMRDVLATVIVLLWFGSLFWPEAMGTSAGEKAGKFMRAFGAAYSKNAAVD